MEALALVWHFLSLPVRLAAFLWPVYAICAGVGLLSGLGMTLLARRSRVRGFHPLVCSSWWPALVALGGLGCLWITISVAAAVLSLAVFVRFG